MFAHLHMCTHFKMHAQVFEEEIDNWNELEPTVTFEDFVSLVVKTIRQKVAYLRNQTKKGKSPSLLGWHLNSHAARAQVILATPVHSSGLASPKEAAPVPITHGNMSEFDEDDDEEEDDLGGSDVVDVVPEPIIQYKYKDRNPETIAKVLSVTRMTDDSDAIIKYATAGRTGRVCTESQIHMGMVLDPHQLVSIFESQIAEKAIASPTGVVSLGTSTSAPKPKQTSVSRNKTSPNSSASDALAENATPKSSKKRSLPTTVVSGKQAPETGKRSKRMAILDDPRIAKNNIHVGTKVFQYLPKLANSDDYVDDDLDNCSWYEVICYCTFVILCTE